MMTIVYFWNGRCGMELFELDELARRVGPAPWQVVVRTSNGWESTSWPDAVNQDQTGEAAVLDAFGDPVLRSGAFLWVGDPIVHLVASARNHVQASVREGHRDATAVPRLSFDEVANLVSRVHDLEGLSWIVAVAQDEWPEYDWLSNVKISSVALRRILSQESSGSIDPTVFRKARERVGLLPPGHMEL